MDLPYVPDVFRIMLLSGVHVECLHRMSVEGQAACRSGETLGKKQAHKLN